MGWYFFCGIIYIRSFKRTLCVEMLYQSRGDKRSNIYCLLMFFFRKKGKYMTKCLCAVILFCLFYPCPPQNIFLVQAAPLYLLVLGMSMQINVNLKRKHKDEIKNISKMILLIFTGKACFLQRHKSVKMSYRCCPSCCPFISIFRKKNFSHKLLLLVTLYVCQWVLQISTH